ncbi:hypothetical protein [Acetobacterium wieringae]|uniref:Uncharacterized protein n=1 Tax=Acetobacterium wieringae TaxID=52694 RepID=A0A1F2PCW1_9FIRM|nr:hypothetical protein [Acetobacterium wieringae]OFV69187.1 hypothetical protein ACWI_33810 [Acetobacterium wieringae]
MSSKKMIIANFNIVFGDDEEPLLNYFDSAILPAFKSEFKKKSGDNEYSFMKVEIKEIDEDGLVLTGIIVKETTIEIKSKFDDEGVLIDTDERYPTAPFSLFAIHLKNHRMTLVKNQKGSPDLKSFSSTFKKVLKLYIRSENEIRKGNDVDLIPRPVVNIVGIPMRESIKEALGKVMKINKLTLRFYPLNGDLDFGPLFDDLISDLRNKVGSKTGSIILNSPTSINGVIEVIEAAQGTIDPLFNVTYPDKSKGTINNNTISENMDITLDDVGNIASELDQVVERTKDFESIAFITPENQEIFTKNRAKILPFINKKR